ncbi:hypothetical protein C8R43DRAFT_641647 [Mycena crocata]|nr:hypothetical protein C8R43DRAFT_641647 [Mycena crocata]
MARSQATRSTRSTRSAGRDSAAAIINPMNRPQPAATISWSIEEEPSITNLLKKHGLILLLPWRILFCLGEEPNCRTGIPYELFAAHCQSVHKQSRKQLKPKILSGPKSFSVSTLDELKVWKICKSYGEFPRPSTIIKPIPWLEVCEGLECRHPACPFPRFVHRSRPMMQRHFVQTHPIYHNSIDPHCDRVMCQSFIADFARYPSWWFRVELDVPERDEPKGKISTNPVEATNGNEDQDSSAIASEATSEPPPHVSDFDAFELFLDGQSEDDVQTDEVDHNSDVADHWTVALGWWKLMEKGDLVDLKKRLRGDGVLRQAVAHYISQAMDALKMNALILSRIVGGKTPLSLEAKTNPSSYISTWTSFLAMVLCDQAEPHDTFPAILSAEVKKCAKALAHKLTSGDMESLSRLVHKLILALLSTNHTRLEKTLEASPLFRFAAIDSHKADLRMDEATNISSKMGRLQFVFRLCVIWQGLLDVKQNPQSDIETSVDKYLPLISHGNELNTWRILQNIKGRAAKNTRKDVKDLRIEWSADGKEFLYAPLDKTITMIDLHTFFHNIHNRSKRHLHDVVLKDVPASKVEALREKMELHRVVDDITRSDVKYSFLTDPRNSFPQEHHYPLLEVLLESRPGYFGTLSDIPGEYPIQWNVPHILQWCQNADHAIYDHLVGSWTQTPASSRGTEMVEVKIQNISTRERELLYLDNHLTYGMGYNKTTNQTGFDRLILRAPCRELGDEIAFYLIYVRPLLVFWAAIAFPEIEDAAQTYEEYLWVAGGKRLKSQDISDALETATLQHLGVGIKIRDWRHIAIAIIRRHLTAIGINGKALEDMMAEESFKDGDSDVEWNDPAMLREYATLCNRWHRFWGFDRKDKESTALYIFPDMDPALRASLFTEAVELMERSVVSLEKRVQYLKM